MSQFFPAYFRAWLLMAGLFSAWGSLAGAASPTEVHDQILDHQEKMHRLHTGMEKQKIRLRETRETEVSLLAELEKIDRLLMAEQQKLTGLRQELTAVQQQLAATEERFGKAVSRKSRLQAHVEKRLAAYYRGGELEIVNTLFSAGTLPDLLIYQEYFNRLFAHDKAVLTDYRTAVAELDLTRQALALETTRLQEIVTRLEEQENILAATQQKRLALLTRVKTEKKLHQRAVREMEAAAANLLSTLEELRGRLAAGDEGVPAPEHSPATREFAAQKGRLEPPAIGTVVTPFGQERQGQFGIAAKSTGIDLATESGAGIRAVFAGRVVYAGYLRGYGNLLIIDHGQQYYTLLSQAARFFKQKGEQVAAGEVLGVMGERNMLAAENLHFEIRHGTVPEDPLEWLDHTRLKIKTARQDDLAAGDQ